MTWCKLDFYCNANIQTKDLTAPEVKLLMARIGKVIEDCINISDEKIISEFDMVSFSLKVIE